MSYKKLCSMLKKKRLYEELEKEYKEFKELFDE